MFMLVLGGCSFSEAQLASLFERYGTVEKVSLLRLSSLAVPGAHVLFKSAKVWPPPLK